MDEQCIPAEELATLRENPDDPRLVHLKSCPRCRALLSGYDRFMTCDPELADSDAEAELMAALDAELSGFPESTPAEPGFLTKLRIGAWLRPALGGMALLLALWFLLPFGEQKPVDPSGSLREQENPAADFRMEAVVIDGGGLRLSWQSLVGASTYRVRLYEKDLSLLAIRSAGIDTVLVVAPGAVFWQVEALRETDPLFSSKLLPLSQK